MEKSKYSNEWGHKIWYLPSKGKWHFHRLDGPAFEGADGTKEWWIDGNRHRLDGPAVEWADGDKEWWFDGKRHRLGGPAYEGRYESKEWWINGNKLNAGEVEDWLEKNNIGLSTNEGQMVFKLKFSTR